MYKNKKYARLQHEINKWNYYNGLAGILNTAQDCPLKDMYQKEALENMYKTQTRIRQIRKQIRKY